MKKSICFMLLAVFFLFSSVIRADTRRVYHTEIDATSTSGYQDIIITQGDGDGQGITGVDLWEALCDSIPPGVTNLTFNYCNANFYPLVLSGTYKNMPPINGVQMKDGIIMTSGFANNCIGPNDADGKSQEHGWPGDGDLQAVVGEMVMDAATLEIAFTSDSTVKGISFIFCFGSEEYPEYVGKFNDVFICLLEGQNICFDSQGNLISVNNAFFNIDNLNGSINLQYDGLTYVLQTSKKISAGKHTVKFAIGDTRDEKLDSGVFLCNFRFDFTQDGTFPIIDIIDDQVFVIPQSTPEQTVIGAITKLTKYGPISLLETNNIPEFYLNGWDIVVSDGVVFDVNQQDVYIMTIKATLDTLWDNTPWIVHDTADMTIRIQDENGWPQIDNAVIYDQDGNGIGDSIFIKLTYTFPDEYSLLQADFSWPSGQIDYSESIDNSNLYNKNTIAFSYAPGNSAPVWTQGQDTISVTIDSLDNKKSTHSGILEDGIGPLLKKPAWILERYEAGNDTFFVGFTEKCDIEKIEGKSFILIKKDGGNEIELTLLDPAVDIGSEDSIAFAIADLGDNAPEEGDSLKILHSGPVVDKPRGNNAHEDNTPVPIRVLLKMIPEISASVIYDADGDGRGDSLVIWFENGVDTEKLSKVLLEWPNGGEVKDIDLSSFHIESFTVLSFVNFEMSGIITSGIGNVIVTFDSSGTNIEKNADVLDGIGPLLKDNAYVVKRYVPGADTFFVTFTEKVNVDQITGESFILLKDDREIILSVIGTAENLSGEIEVSFSADLGGETPEIGDSLKIFHQGPVIDKRDNSAHPDNTPAPIKFIYGSVPVKNAYYHDVNGDGIVDRVRVEFVDTVKNIDKITFDVTWTDIIVSAKNVNAEFESGSQMNVRLDLNNAFDNAEKIIDKTSGTMDLILTYDTTNIPATYTVIDKAAPVIFKATYYLTNFIIDRVAVNDTLIVVFSEPVNEISSDRPFLLKTVEDGRYHFVLNQVDINENRVKFHVSYIEGVKTPLEGDSIWINASEGVEDNLDNPQIVEDNKRVELIVKTPPYELIPHVIGPTGPEEKTIPKELKISDHITEGTVIILKPDMYVPYYVLVKVKCSIKIFDAVGNLVALCNGNSDKNGILEMSPPIKIGSNYKIIILWSDNNLLNRKVGRGSYLGVINIDYQDDRKTENKKILIPMKK